MAHFVVGNIRTPRERRLPKANVFSAGRLAELLIEKGVLLRDDVERALKAEPVRHRSKKARVLRK